MEQQGTCGLDFEGGPGNCGAIAPRLEPPRTRRSCSPRTSRPSSTSSRCSATSAATTRRRLMARPRRRRGDRGDDLQALLAAAAVPRRRAARGAATELVGAVAELPRSPAAAALERFCAWWTATDPLALAQHYVETLDLHKRSGLYLTFYGEGDKRERGMALLRLKRALPRGRPAAGGHRAARLPAGDARVRGRRARRPRRARAARAPRRARARARSACASAGAPTRTLLDAVCLTLGEPSAADRARVAQARRRAARRRSSSGSSRSRRPR